MSYFEWLKNLDHVRWGRLFRKWEEKSKKNLLEVVQKATGGDEKKYDKARKKLLEGATERDIVYGGLEEIISTATSEVIEISKKLRKDEKNPVQVPPASLIKPALSNSVFLESPFCLV